jgi:ankyrin repeat protein
VVRLLLDAGACPLRLNAHSRAAAALALAAGQLAALRLLLEHTGELAALTAWAQGQQQQQQQQQQQGTSAVVAAGAESQAAGALGRQPGGAATGPAASGATQLLPQVSNASKAWQTGFTAGALPRQRPLTLSALERERQRYQLLLGALLAAQAEGGGPAAAAAAAVRAAATPAALAHAAAGSEALLDALLRCGASLACVDPADGSFPLLAACHLGWPAMLRLLRRGADPNQADASGGTALALLASRPGMADALAALLRWDAALPPGHPRLDLWRRDAAGRDAVGAALAARNRAAAELLLDELAARQEAAAAASQASQQRQHQQQQAGGAEGAGAEAGAVPPRAAGASPSPAASRAYELLLAQGARCVADINRPPEGGQHPLLAAAAAGTRKQLRQVLQLPGMDAGVRDGAGRTALLLAAARQQPALVAELVGSGRVDVAARDAAGCTAVLLAARAGCAAVLRVLVEAGAGELGPSRLEHCAAPLAAGAGKGAWRSRTSAALQSSRRSPPPPPRLPADASAADHEGSTPLMALAAGGQHKLLAELLRSAHPPPLDAADRRGWTALHHAAAAGSFNACKVLRGWGADASLRAGEGGPTAAELASRGGHASCLPLLQPPAEPPVTQ